MKTLTLIRHAKSSWDLPMIDKNRPLSSRGVQDAHLVSQAFKKMMPGTFLVWSSTAKRAKETAVIFAENLNWPFDRVVLKDELYTFDKRDLERIVKSIDSGYENVIIFGHNEAISDFVHNFAHSEIGHVPTCGVVSIQWNVNQWSEIDRGNVVFSLFPRDVRP
jgi:phosphohistidine phosphatase